MPESNFPTSLDSFAVLTAHDNIDTTGKELDKVLTKVNEALANLEAKVGVDGSAVTSSHDYKLAQAGLANGYATLNASSKVVQDPANATATPTNDKIPIASASGKLDSWISADRLVTQIDAVQRIFMSRLPNVGVAFTTLTGTAYFVYVGKLAIDLTPKFVEFWVSTAGTGAQTAEVGLFSSPAGPNKAGQTLTKLVSTGTVDSLTTAGIKRNTSAFATSIAAGTHLWAGIRTAMATTQPAVGGLVQDNSQGHALSTGAAGALTGAGPWSGAIIALPSYLNSTVAPELRVTLD